MLRMPPPMRQGSRLQIAAAMATLLPSPLAASRSISWTRGKRENRVIQTSGSAASIASFSPCTSWTMRPPCKSIDGINMGQALEADRDLSVAEVSLQLADARVGVVKDRRGQCRVGVAAREYVRKVIEPTRAAGRDDWDVDGVGDRSGHLAV